MPRTPEGGLRRLALALPRWAIDYAASGWMHFLEPFFPDVPDTLRRHDSAGPDIVLIPGVFQTWVAMYRIADELHRRGYRVHAVPALGHNRQTIGRSARVVRQYLASEGLETVYLVAHSKGGLIGKRLLVEQRKAQKKATKRAPAHASTRIIGMTALASPFHGSSYATYMPSRSLRRFQPGDKAIARLSEHNSVNGVISSIYGRFDPHIPEGSYLPGAAHNIEVPTTGHMQVLRDSLTVAIAAHVIDTECVRLTHRQRA